MSKNLHIISQKILLCTKYTQIIEIHIFSTLWCVKITVFYGSGGGPSSSSSKLLSMLFLTCSWNSRMLRSRSLLRSRIWLMQYSDSWPHSVSRRSILMIVKLSSIPSWSCLPPSYEHKNEGDMTTCTRRTCTTCRKYNGGNMTSRFVKFVREWWFPRPPPVSWWSWLWYVITLSISVLRRCNRYGWVAIEILHSIVPWIVQNGQEMSELSTKQYLGCLGAQTRYTGYI